MQAFDQLPKDEQIAQLTNEHRAISFRIQEINQHGSLTTAERVERDQLRKRRMQTRDELIRLCD